MVNLYSSACKPDGTALNRWICTTHNLVTFEIDPNRFKSIVIDREHLPPPLFVVGMTQKSSKIMLNRVGLEPTHLSILASDDNDADALSNHLKLAP